VASCPDFWAGEFGDEYTVRNASHDQIVIRERFFLKVINIAGSRDKTAIEFGTNIGLNLMALTSIGFDESLLCGVEINELAAAEARKNLPNASILCSNVDDCGIDKYDLFDYVVSMGFLIHQDSERLPGVLDVMFNACAVNGHMIIAEYFAPEETEVDYRGNAGKLWRRDYGGMILRRFAGKTSMVNYGFASKDDPMMPMDNINYWVIRRTAE
jgi:pseudaminic acid biosynthesis-associated methylase